MKFFQLKKITVYVAESAEKMAEKAAVKFAESAKRLLEEKSEINVIFSGAESQQAFHKNLTERDDIEWPKINAFGVDEFYAPEMPAEMAVCAQPQRDLYSKVPLKLQKNCRHLFSSKLMVLICSWIMNHHRF